MKKIKLKTIILSIGISFFVGNAQAVNNSNNEAKKDSEPDILMIRPDIVVSELEDPFYSYLVKIEVQNKDALKKLNEEKQREKEALEFFELNALKLSGIYNISGKNYATIEDSTGKGYTVTLGNYIGTNNGVIKDINLNSKEILIVEKTLTPTGVLKNVETTISLANNNKQ